jgi:hypothetical protein
LSYSRFELIIRCEDKSDASQAYAVACGWKSLAGALRKTRLAADAGQLFILVRHFDQAALSSIGCQIQMPSLPSLLSCLIQEAMGI